MENMNNETVETKKGIVERVKSFGKKAVDSCKDKIEYAKENPVEAAEICMYTIGGLGMAALTIAGLQADSKSKRSVYSKDIGENVELKKKLSNDDKVALDHIMAEEGLTKIQALQKLGKIK